MVVVGDGGGAGVLHPVRVVCAAAAACRGILRPGERWREEGVKSDGDDDNDDDGGGEGGGAHGGGEGGGGGASEGSRKK